MPKFRVLLTDYAWPDVEIERDVLAKVDAELIVAPHQDVGTLTQLAADVDAIMTCWASTTAAVIAAAKNCRIVARMGIGLDNIDVEYCTQQRIPVTNVPDYCVAEVAEHALALIFALARNVAFYHHETSNGRYDLQAGPVPRRIAGQTLGIIGLGNIGGCLASKAAGLGLHVIAATRTPRSGFADVPIVELDELLPQSDFVSLHLPLDSPTRHFISAERLSRMKRTAFLVNTARGGLVDHVALSAALKAGQLAGAALDVQDPEPPDLDQPPYNDPRVLVTPHAAFLSTESLVQLRRRSAGQVAARLTGGIPENVVNPRALNPS